MPVRAWLPHPVLARRRAAAVAIDDLGRGRVAPQAELLDDAGGVLEGAVRCPPAAPAPWSPELRGAEQRVRLVDQRDVGLGPVDVAHARRTGPREQLVLVARQDAVGRRPDESGKAEQVVHELGAREHRPHALERGPHLRCAPEARRQLGFPVVGRALTPGERRRHWHVEEFVLGLGRQRERGVRVDTADVALVRRHQRPPVLVAQLVQHHARHGRTPLVVGAAPASDTFDDPSGVGSSEAQHVTVEHDDEVVAQRTFAVAQRPPDHPRHAGIALQCCDRRRLGRPRPQLGLEPGHGRELHVVLAQRREHLVDVAKEDGARSDEQHAPGREPLAVRVEQVRGAVERDGRLARAGAAGDHEDAGQRGAHRLVLLGLDRGDDVAHPARAMTLQRGEERGLAHDREAGLVGGGRVEDLVVDADQLPPLGLEVPAPDDAHGLDAGGAVERLGDRGAPVDDQRRLIGLGDGDPPDVEAVVDGTLPVGAGLQVDASEGQGRVPDVQGREPPAGVGGGGVTLEPGLVGAPPLHLGIALGDPAGGLAHLVQASVGTIEVPLLGGELGVGAAFSDAAIGLVRHARLLRGDLAVYFVASVGLTGSCSDGPRGTVTSSGSRSTTRSPSERSVGVSARSQRPPRLGRRSGIAPSDRSIVRITPPWVTTRTSPVPLPSTAAARPARVRASNSSSPSKSGGERLAARYPGQRSSISSRVRPLHAPTSRSRRRGSSRTCAMPRCFAIRSPVRRARTRFDAHTAVMLATSASRAPASSA